jgi:GTP cyclohydrolase II
LPPPPHTAALSPSDEVTDELFEGLRAAWSRPRPGGRPFVTLAYAQSIDGSIACEPGRPYALSGPAALRLTHTLRSAHDAILVGIGTLVADDPQLTVRLVEGPSPQAIVVDSRLRTPERARVFDCNGSAGRPVWIATTAGADRQRGLSLEARGARVVRLPAWANGWVDIPALLGYLGEKGMTRVMVEGGSRIITSFLRSRMVDYAVVTVAPRLLGGLSAIGQLDGAAPPRIDAWTTHRLGDDLVLSGEVLWEAG